MKRIIVLCWLFVTSANVLAAAAWDFLGINYRTFNGCYFNNHHEFTQQLNALIKQQAKLGKGVIFDEPVVIGFSSRKPSNNGFYVDYEQTDCTPNFETMQSTCTIKVTGFKYGAVPGIYKKIYLDTLRAHVDATLLNEFVAALVRGLGANASGVEIAGLGTFIYDSKKAAVVFDSIPLDQFDALVAAPDVMTALDCNRNDVGSVVITIVGGGTVNVTSTAQFFGSESSNHGLSTSYFYPRYSSVQLTAVPAVGQKLVNFECNYIGRDSSSITTAVNPLSISEISSYTTCTVNFVSDAPAVPVIGSSPTEIVLLSKQGVIQLESGATGYEMVLDLERSTWIPPRKLMASMKVVYCSRLDYNDPRWCYRSYSTGEITDSNGSYETVPFEVTLGVEYTIVLKGITARFIVKGWGVDSYRGTYLHVIDNF
jgi:hypothetical protein